MDYINITTHPDRCNYSDIHDCYILNDHSEWRDDVRDYIYTGEYSFLNDTSSIEERIRLNQEHQERENSRRSRRTTSQPEVSFLMSELERIGMDYFTLRNNIEVERENTREEATDELP